MFDHSLRLCDIKDGETIIHQGAENIVRVNDREITIQRITTVNKNNSIMHFGLNCQMWVEKALDPSGVKK